MPQVTKRLHFLINQTLASNKVILIDIVALSVTGLISLTWFRGNYLISNWTTYLPANPAVDLNLVFYVWRDIAAPGMITTLQPITFLYVLYFYCLKSIGLSVVMIEKVFVYFLFTFSGLSMYYLTSVVLNLKFKRFASLSAAFFYMFNMYSMIVLWGDFFSTALIMLYAFMPLILALFIQGLNSQKPKKYIVLLSLVFILVQYVYQDPVYIFIMGFILFCYFVYYSLIHYNSRLEIRRAFKFSLILVILWLLLNMWWLLQLFYFWHVQFSYATNLMGGSNVQVLNFVSSEATLSNVFRLFGYWGFNQSYLGEPYFPFASIYSTTGFVLLSFMIPLLAFSSFLLKSKNRQILGYFGILSLLGIFLAKGSQGPFGGVFIWFMSSFPVLGIFRMAFIKFTTIITLGYAVLIGCAIAGLCSLLEGKLVNSRFVHAGKRVTRTSCWVLFILFIISTSILVFPMFTGDMISSGNNVVPSMRLQIPSYYDQANNWLNGQDEVFDLYAVPLETQVFNWSSGSQNILWLFQKPIYSYNNINDLVQVTENMISLNETASLGKALGMLNVKYLVLLNDANQIYNEPYWGTETPSYCEAILNSATGINLVHTFDKLEFYGNDYFLPRIYGATNAIYVNGGVNEMMQVIEEPDFNNHDSIVLLSSQNNEQYIDNNSQITVSSQNSLENNSATVVADRTLPTVTFTEVNPTKYLVNVNASEPFFLVFSETYDANWIASIAGSPLNNHFIANGFANAWYVDKVGSFDVVIEFSGQRLIYYGIAVSSVTVICSTIYVTKDRIIAIYRHSRRRKPQHS